MGKPVSFVFTSHKLRWLTFSWFNANAYPKPLEGVLNACGVKLSLMGVHAERAAKQEPIDYASFLAELTHHLAGASPESWVALDFIAYYHSIELIDALSNTIYYLKAFLDSFAQLVCRLVAPGESSSEARRFSQAKAALPLVRCRSW